MPGVVGNQKQVASKPKKSKSAPQQSPFAEFKVGHSLCLIM